MKKVFVALIVAAMTLSMGVGSVEAKRLGGGGSFGKQSSGASRQAQSPMQQSQAAPARPAAPAAAPAAAAAKPSPWKGMLGGALLGLGLGALLSHFGMGGAMAGMISTILMIALLAVAAMFIYRMVRRKMDGGNQRAAYATGSDAYQGSGASNTPVIGSLLEPTQPPKALQGGTFGGAGAGSAEAEQAATYGIPKGFDTVGFVRNAKTYFIRLQAAWDKADTNDIREFTSPEMFAELKMQLQERGASANHTDVVSLDADMLGVEVVGNDYLASVKFFGFIKEEQSASPTQFSEIWNLSKPVSSNGGWVLAGIQQLS